MDIRYLGYNILKTDYKQLNKYVSNAKAYSGKSKLSIYKDVISTLFNNGTDLTSFFYYRYFDKEVDRSINTNVWQTYLFQSKFNSKRKFILRDKLLFRKTYHSFFKYDYFELTDKSQIEELLLWIKLNKLDKVVAKDPLGVLGKQVSIIEINFDENYNIQNESKLKSEILYFYKEKRTLFEAFINQHPTLNEVYPNAINTVRAITFVDDNKNVEIWGCILRMGVTAKVDNFASGGIAAKIDVKSGCINSEAYFKNPFDRKGVTTHPKTGTRIKGLEIPFWNETLKFIKEIALVQADVRTVGWDIAITENGPTIVEGNDNWDPVIFETTSDIGLKEIFNKYLNEK